MKKSIIQIVIYAVLIIAIVVLSSLLVKSCSNNQSLTQSNSALFLQYQKVDSLVKLYKTTTGMSAASVKIVQATKTDIKNGIHENVSQLESAGINNNEITTIGAINAAINVDSIKWSYQTKIDSLKSRIVCATFRDDTFEESLCYRNDSIINHFINCRVHLIWGTSEIHKKIWFITLPKWLFGIKERIYTIMSTSKYITLTGAEYIEKR